MAANETKAVLAMKLRLQITLDIRCADHLDATGHQRRIEHFLDLVRTQYPRANISLTHSRPPSAAPKSRRSRGRRATGAVAGYTEV
jgi:hypothetical protein